MTVFPLTAPRSMSFFSPKQVRNQVSNLKDCVNYCCKMLQQLLTQMELGFQPGIAINEFN